jgi:shikimate dehydrogenase
MDVYAILGFPVGHSRSPAMQNRAFEALGIDARYVPFAVDPRDLEDAVRGLRALHVCGVNVTLPHKTAIIPLLDEIDATASRIGAVNTVWRDGERLLGTNTDAEGLCRALREGGGQLMAASATVLGAGGAARASVVGLAEAGVRQIRVAARRLESAQALVSDLSAKLPGTPLCALDLSASALAAAFRDTDLLVQATSATLDGHAEAREFAASLPLEALPASALVTDLVYRPLETAVLRRASARGLATVDGLGMLLHQGALAFERWTGKPAPLDQMRDALLRAATAPA